jgi:hypothetical protein
MRWWLFGIVLTVLLEAQERLDLPWEIPELACSSSRARIERRRWRIALYVVPWSMTVYWHRYVRR